MLSVVSVYNDLSKLNQRLCVSLSRQNRSYEFIPVDNSSGRFSSAAAALNHGATIAKGDWIAFVHQDIEFLGEDWLQRAEHFLAAIDGASWCGLVGRTNQGRWRGMIRDRSMVFGEPFLNPIEVQTLDEIVLMTANRRNEIQYFDENLRGWHAYGVDACLTAITSGGKNYVLPLPVWHDSASTNQAGLREAHAFVWGKHKNQFRRVYTTCGVLPHGYGVTGSYRLSRIFRRVRHFWYAPWIHLAGSSAGFDQTPWELLENLTASETLVHCFHGYHPIQRIDAVAFTDRTSNPRIVIHEFCGLSSNDTPKSSVVVIAPELAGTITSKQSLPLTSRLFICVYLDVPEAKVAKWASLLGRSFRCHLAMEHDETRWAVLEYVP